MQLITQGSDGLGCIRQREAVLGEFTACEAISKLALGASKMRLFRPPYFILNANVRETANRLGYQIIMGEYVGDAIPVMTVDLIKQRLSPFWRHGASITPAY